MPVIKLAGFGGMTPILDDRLIDDHAASYAENAWLQQGNLNGMPVVTPVHTLADPATQYVFRIPNGPSDATHLPDSTWMEFQNPYTVVLPGMVAHDEFDRYYICEPGQPPRYNTLARIKAGQPPYTLGIPGPPTAMVVTSTGGVSSTVVTRAYTCTWVSTYHEEGIPCPPTVHTGKVDDIWSLSAIPQPGPADLANRTLASINIYRTVVAANGFTDFYLVANVPIGTTTYTDSAPDIAIVGGSTLLSADWVAPPVFDGWIQMPNGIIAAWTVDKDVYFCEPYRPHAWPAEYVLSVDYAVVGMGVLGQTLMVMTENRPYAITGATPHAMTMSAVPTIEPCTSRGSIVSSLEGVLFTSPNGLILTSPGVAQNVTFDKISRNQWTNLVPLATLRASRLGDAYYCWGTQIDGSFNPGAFLNPSVPGVTPPNNVGFAMTNFGESQKGVVINLLGTKQSISVLTNLVPLRNLVTDVWTGSTLVIRGNIVYWVDANNKNIARETYRWVSKIFKTPFMKNLAAARIFFDTNSNSPPAPPYLTLNVYADDRLVLTRPVNSSGELLRLPSGFKASWWKFDITSYVPIDEVIVATSAKELLGA